jgi:hypothetical protein
MSEMTLFGAGNPLANSDLFKSLRDMNKTLAGGGGGGGKRISIKGNKFRLFVDGEQVSVSKEDHLNIVVVNVAAVSRTYYEGTYDPNNTAAPTCWSADTKAPSPDVPADQRKASRCTDCPMNVKGSGQGDSRACRYNQRLAITLEGKPDEVYQLQLPATSLFGDGKNGKMPMQAYAKFLDAHDTPIIAVMTKMSLDENSETPKLFFSPVRPLTEKELNEAVAVRDSEDAIKAITLTVAQTDGVKKKDSAAGTKSYNPAKEKIIVDDEDEIEEPKKVEAKKMAMAGAGAKPDLSAIVTEWDDE